MKVQKQPIPLEDLRRTNLRLATRSQNAMNKRANQKRLKGAGFHAQSGKWRARLMINYKEKHLGMFETQQLAHEAYCRAAKIEFGEFARAA